MPSPFADSELWSHATFKFDVADGTSTIGDRGQRQVTTRKMAVTFKMRPRDYVPQNQGNLGEDVKSETYEGRVVAVDDDFDVMEFPKVLSPNDVGVGEVNGRSCRATVDRVAQSSVNPLLKTILGEKVSLKVTYSMVRSVNGI